MAAPRAEFRAPWSRELTLLSGLGLFAIGLPVISAAARGAIVVSALLASVSLVLVSLTVRGYRITPDRLLIRRLFWNTVWPLSRPTTVTVQPGAMAGSWRLWGNGGLFAFSGHFSNRALGRYRAFATDLERTVVLHTPRGLVVVSPDDPGEFAASVVSFTQPGAPN